MSVITITKDNFEQEVLKAATPIILDFWAPWCGYCTMLSPVLDQLANENSGKIAVGKINTDEQPELASKYGVQSLPTLLLFKDGKNVSTSMGAKPKPQLEDWLRQNGAL